MIKEMKLRGTVTLQNNTMIFTSRLFDDTEFSVNVFSQDVQINEYFSSTRTVVDGWLNVTQESQQGSLVKITLPSPSIRFGRQIAVRDLQLMPRNVTLADFLPQEVVDFQTNFDSIDCSGDGCCIDECCEQDCCVDECCNKKNDSVE